MKGFLRGIALVLGALFLAPFWLIDVRWGRATIDLIVLPCSSDISLSLPLAVAKVFLAGLGLLLGCIALALWRNFPAIRSVGFGQSAWAAVAALLVAAVGIICLEPFPLFSADGSVAIDLGRNLYATAGMLIRTIGFVLLVWGLGPGVRSTVGAAWDRVSSRLIHLGMLRGALVSGIVVCILGAIYAVVGFKMFPSIRDEVAALFQAGIFAQGKLVLSAPSWSEFMDFSPVITQPSWSSMYTPGWAALLVPGLISGVPWLVNPIFSGLLMALLFRLVFREVGAQEAWLSTLLLVTSPFFLRLSGSFMSHTAALLLLLVSFSLVLDWPARSNPFAGMFAGVALGGAMATRPWAAFTVALPMGWWCLRGIRLYHKAWICFWIPMIAGVALIGGLVSVFNHASTGCWWLPGYVSRLGALGSVGFGERGMGAHTPLLAFFHDLGRFFWLSRGAFGIPLPGALIMALGISVGIRKPSHAFLYAGFFLLWVGSGFYWWYEHWFGPRYLFEGLPAVILASVIGLGGLIRRPRFASWAKTGLLISFFWGATVVIPGDLVSISRGYGEVDRATVQMLRDPSLQGSAVLIQDFDETAWPHDTYTNGFLAMVLDDFAGALILRDLGVANRRLVHPFPPGRWFYYAHGDARGEGSLTAIDGPGDVPSSTTHE